MESKINKKTVAGNFSRYAPLYDKYADIQYLAAQELIKELPCNGVEDILEIGCGTGNYTWLLREKFKDSFIMAIDISKKMIEVAGHKFQKGRINFVVVDAEDMDINEKFDIITSNAAFQWFNNIEGAFVRYKKALKENGALVFTIFGPLTFLELSWSLKEALNRNESISSTSFLERRELDAILKKHFREIWMKELIIKERYCCLLDLLNKIKYTGTRGRGANSNFLWGKELLKKIEEIYNTRFGHIEATYQIFFFKAIR